MKKRVFLTSIITLVVLVICAALFAIPGQFAHLGSRSFSAYEVIFFYANVNGNNYLADNFKNAHASVAGIIALVLMLLGAISFAFGKKDRSLPLLGGIASGLAGLLFLTMNLWMATIYKMNVELYWLTYVAGAFMLISGVASCVFAIKDIKESNAFASEPKSKQYSYLNSNKKKDR